MQTYLNLQHLEDNRQEWLDRVKNGEKGLLKVLYQFYRIDFIRWIQNKTSCGETEAVDVFQDTVIAIYHNIQKGTLTNFSKGIGHYLFTVGKYIYIRKANRKKQVKTGSLEEIHTEVAQFAHPPDESSLENEEQRFLLVLLRRMKDPCKSILNLFYYENRSIKQIMEELGYGSEGAVKVQKLRCMKRLKAAAAKLKKK